MDKKFIAVLVLTVIFITVLALCFFIFPRKETIPVNKEPETISIQEEIRSEGSKSIEPAVKTPEKCETLTKPARKSAYPVTTKKKQQLSSEKLIEPQQNTLTESAENNNLKNSEQPAVLKEEPTGEVIIPIEYKMASPAKYSFK